VPTPTLNDRDPITRPGRVISLPVSGIRSAAQAPTLSGSPDAGGRDPGTRVETGTRISGTSHLGTAEAAGSVRGATTLRPTGTGERLAGTLLFGQYRLVDPPQVDPAFPGPFHAIDVFRNNEVALHRCTRVAPGTEDPAIDRVRALVAVPEHPHLVTVHGMVQDRTSRFVVTDWVTGIPLSRANAASGRAVGTHPDRPHPEWLRILDQVGAALTHLHEQDPELSHGALTADRVLLTPTGRAVVVGTEAGPPRRLRRVQDRTHPDHAPELDFGWPPMPATDVYALARIAGQLLTGAAAGLGPRLDGRSWPDGGAWHGGGTEEGLGGRQNSRSRTAARLARVVGIGTAPDPADRPQSVREFLGLLHVAF